MTPIRYRGHDCLSFRQLDELNGLVKGSAFRAFKGARAQLEEGTDFFLLDAQAEAALIAELRGQGLIYRGSVNIVLITRTGYQRIQAAR